MSYSIRYGPERPESAPRKQPLLGLIGAVLIIAVCAMAVGWGMPEQAQRFTQALFPWTKNEVRAALTELHEDVREGNALSDAVTAFCREVIHEAQNP